MTQLSISNIAWPTELRNEIYAELADADVIGLEIAPTKFAPWQDLTLEVAREERNRIRSIGLQVSSYQALYFNRPDCQLLSDDTAFDALRAHTIHVAAFAECLSSGGPGVFGAPRNRQRGSLNAEVAFEIGAERFRRLAETVSTTGFVIALEAAPEEYGGDFLVTTAQCAAMVRAVNHPSFKLHLDIGCLALTGEKISEIISEHHDIIAHVHLSKPKLVSIVESDTSIYRPVLSALEQAEYRGWTAIEMREMPDSLAAVREAVSTIKSAISSTC